MIIQALFDAVVHDHTHERSGKIAGEKPFDDVVAGMFQIDEGGKLTSIGLQQLIEIAEIASLARCRPQTFSRARIDTVVQGQFENLRPVQIPRETAALLAMGTDGDASAGPAVAGILQGFALMQQLLHDHIGTEHRWLAKARAHHLAGSPQKCVRVARGQLNAAAGLRQTHFLHDVENHEGDLVDRILAPGIDPADIDQGKVGVGAALLLGDSHLRRCRLIVELDPEAAQQFPSFGSRQRPGRQALPIEGIQMLIQPAGIEGIPGIQFRNHSQMDEPVHLQSLVECPRRVGRHLGADLGDSQQFLLPGFVLLLGGQPPRLGGIASGKGNQGVAANVHGPVGLPLPVGLGVVQGIEGGAFLGNLDFEIEKALVVNLVVQNGMARGALFHEFGEHPGLEGGMPGRRHGRKKTLAHGLASPKRNDLPGVDLTKFRRNPVGSPLATVQNGKVVERMTTQLRVGRRGLGSRSTLAHNQLARLNHHRALGHETRKTQGPAYRRRNRQRSVATIKIRDDPGPLGRKIRLNGQTPITQLPNTLGHDSHSRWTKAFT